MNIQGKNKQFFKDFDEKFAYKKPDLGIKFLKDFIQLKIWQPLAKRVEVLVYSPDDLSKEVYKFTSQKLDVIWRTNIPLEYEGYFYQYKIWDENNEFKICLDPYAISLAPFNWQGDETKVGFGALVNIDSKLAGKKPRKLKWTKNNHTDSFIYELNVRDFTSLKNQNELKNQLGTFNSLLENNLFDYVKKIGMTHVQFLPIHSAYTVNDLNNSILLKNQGDKWTTNYNWGYDPHNYFSINGIYSSNPKDPYNRIKEFRELIDKAHEKGVGIIMDVVYNHMMTNNIFNNIIPGYYYRDNAKHKPVIYPPLADERFMVKRLIIDSLKYFATEFNIDGFRFDLSCFHHKETIDELTKELREINPNIILHGEAWKFTDLNHKSSYVKGVTDNNIAFGYFNDTLRDSIKGPEHNSIEPGLITKYDKDLFKKYVTSVPGNLKDFDFKEFKFASDNYSLFANDISINLAYSACHDGFTLWDKINITANKNVSFLERIEMYRQALMMTVLVQGRQFMLAGTELLQSKPCDVSGEEPEKCMFSPFDDFNEQPYKNSFHPNSYKTTDYVNGIKWNHLDNILVKEYVFDFVSNLNKFRNKTPHFRLGTNSEIFESLKFKTVDVKNGILIFEVSKDNKLFQVLHNFSNSTYEYEYTAKDKILFSSRINFKKGELLPNSSILMEKK
ncbi:alpha-amylase family glycosyl hydrolase [Mycoplasmopsis felis]|uniref:alpha-amylase family glycosyl hydrolase n=1 Tax=Mycoplasmopsis felis TaxID=33923 RepID=UPI002AF6C710|nr:alpha-amylase family glycosyl hydrolase [Mycoplasmopsis felis]WQQ01432.1 alpha-amylase family glycosyl hydrolase [Mycoplasmopsis felis]